MQPCKSYDGYYGWQISADTAISRVDNVQSRLDGLGVAALFDHQDGLGLSAYRLASPLDRDSGGRQRRLSLNYYLLEYSWLASWQDIFSSRWSLSLGQGSLQVKEAGYKDAVNNAISTEQRYRVWVGEIRWGYYVTLTEFLRVGLDIGYRYVPVDGESMRGNNFSGMSYAIALRGGAL